jgi:hypothetical protein
MRKQPRLRPEDGAEFFGSAKREPDGEWLATCYARNDRLGQTEEAIHRLFHTEQEAWNWIHAKARAGRFERVNKE